MLNWLAVMMLAVAAMGFALFGLMLHALSGQPPRSKRREHQAPYQPNPYTPFKLRLREYEAFAQAYEKANSLRSSAPPDGLNTSWVKRYPSSIANPAETPMPLATAAIPSDFSSSGTGGFDTRGRVLTIGLTQRPTPELLTPSTAMTSSDTPETGGMPGRVSHD